MRAPPDADTMTSGIRRAMERSIARVIISPTTHPMLPPMKRASIEQICTGRPATAPAAEIIASESEVAARMPSSRSR